MARRIKAASLAGYLTVAGFLSFAPLFFWKSKGILMMAAGLTWIAMTYVGAMALFGSKETSIAIMWQGRTHPSKIVQESSARFFGAILLFFMVFVAYEMLHGGLRSAYDNFGR